MAFHPPINWNQKPHRYTVDVPEPLVPLVDARKNSVPYPSVSKYIYWTIIYEMTLQKPHRLTPWLMRQPENIQHDFYEELIRNFGNPDAPRPGSWMERRIREEAFLLVKSGEVDSAVIARAEALGWRRGY